MLAASLPAADLPQLVSYLRKTPAWSRLAVKCFGEAAPEILREARKE